MEPIDFKRFTKFLGLETGEVAGKLTGRPLASDRTRMLPVLKFPAVYWPFRNGSMAGASIPILPGAQPIDGALKPASLFPFPATPEFSPAFRVRAVSFPQSPLPWLSRFAFVSQFLPGDGKHETGHTTSTSRHQSMSASPHDRPGISTPSRRGCLPSVPVRLLPTPHLPPQSSRASQVHGRPSPVSLSHPIPNLAPSPSKSLPTSPLPTSSGSLRSAYPRSWRGPMPRPSTAAQRSLVE